MTATTITLPHGLWDGQERRSEAVLRAPTGADEAFLLETRDHPAAERVTGLLGRCVERIGEVEVDDDHARALTVGDREALLLHLRRTVFGDRLECVLDCPSCGERMDVELSVADLLVAAYDEVRCEHVVPFESNGVRGEAVVRLVTGADQEAAARVGGERGVEALLERCVLEAKPATFSPDDLAVALSRPLAELDEQAEISMDAICPSCEEPFAALLDAAGILFPELTSSDDRLLREVDAIARVYHWSEAEILALDVGRRRRYLELLAEEPGGEA